MSKVVPHESNNRGQVAAELSSGVEAHSIDFIPEGERHGRTWRQGLFWFICNFNAFSITLGFIGPTLGLSLGWSVIASVAGALFGGFFVSFHASQGPQLGLPQMIQSRAQFGYRGVLVPVLASLFNFLVFNVLQGDVLQSGLSDIYGWNPVAIVIVVSALAGLVAIYGYDWLHVLFRILFWVCFPFYAILTIGILAGNVAGDVPGTPGGFSMAAFMATFAAAATYNISLAPYVSDYTRYLPSATKTAHIVFAVQAGICLSLVWLMAVGAWLALRTGATDGLSALYSSGNELFPYFGTVLAGLSALGLVATMSINTYSAVLAVATIIDCIRPVTPTRKLRVFCTIGLFCVWVPISINVGEDQATLITNMLSILLYLLVPWTAVNLVDFFFVRKGHYAITEIGERDGIYGTWAWQGLVAYFAGLLAQLPFMVLSFYKGPVANLVQGIDIAFIVGLAASTGVYLLLARSIGSQAEDAAIDRSDALLHREGLLE